MKIIGRKILAAAEVSTFAKKRLSLWIKQLAESSLMTPQAMRNNYPDATELDSSRFTFNFFQSNVQVVTLINFDLGIVCIEKVIEQEVTTR